MDAFQKKSSVALLSVVSNSTLVVLKLLIGFLIGSVSVISEAIHSGVDLIAAVIAYYAVRTSGVPADKEHPYGHGKIENLSGTIEALLIFVAAIWIIYEAVKKLMHPEPLDATGWGVAVMLGSAVINWVVSNKLFKVGRQTGSVALEADGWHLRTDVYTSLGVMGGLLMIALGKIFFPQANLDWIDPVAAILVAMLIFKAAWELTIQAGRDLLDASIPDEEESWVRQYLNSFHPKVLSYHKLRTRKAGHCRFLDAHIVMPGDMTIFQGHEICDQIGAGLKERFPGVQVTLHMEPPKE